MFYGLYLVPHEFLIIHLNFVAAILHLYAAQLQDFNAFFGLLELLFNDAHDVHFLGLLLQTAVHYVRSLDHLNGLFEVVRDLGLDLADIRVRVLQRTLK